MTCMSGALGTPNKPARVRQRDDACRMPCAGQGLGRRIRPFTSALHRWRPAGYPSCESLNPPIKEGVSAMASVARIPRSRGGVSGVLLILLGAWGGLVPFVGPDFHYPYTPDKPWAYPPAPLRPPIFPGAAAVIGGPPGA